MHFLLPVMPCHRPKTAVTKMANPLKNDEGSIGWVKMGEQLKNNPFNNRA
jgi:hypothetical protein